MSDEDLIRQQFDLEIDRAVDDEVLERLAERIDQLLAGDLENFMSMMYRLDVAENKIQAALSPDHDEAPGLALARLIIDRQLQRIHTKQIYRQQPLEDWFDF